MRAMGDETVNTCSGCNRIWPTHKLGPHGCTNCSNQPTKKQKRPYNNKKLQCGLTMRSALPEELEVQHIDNNQNANVTVTTEIIRLSILNMLENTTKDTAPSKSPKDSTANSRAPWLWFTTATLGHPPRRRI